jgi:hypothetical protein
MDNCQELTCITDLGDCAMEVITWRVSCEFIKFHALNVHLG